MLKEIFDNDLRFAEYRGPLIHRIHGFAAKFPPQLPQYFIRTLSKHGDVVLDPMVGSGTTLVEAMLLGRRSVGVDIDPLAVLQSKVKTALLDDKEVVENAKKIAIDASILMMEKGTVSDSDNLDEFLNSYDSDARRFFSYWFRPVTVAELSLLVGGIDQLEDVTVKNALRVVLSSIIISKNAGVSLALDITHTRPHRVLGKKVKRAIPLFEEAALKTAKSLREINDKAKEVPFRPSVLQGDSKALPLKNRSVELIVTSPPYATALDYMRAHKFSLMWLGYRPQRLSELRSKYIGAESRSGTPITELETVDDFLANLASRDLPKAKAIARYFIEMRAAIQEMYRVLEPKGHAVVVVGPSSVRGTTVMTHSALAEIAADEGFECADVKKRDIERNWRQLPVSNNSHRKGIEARMHEEFILLFYKP